MRVGGNGSHSSGSGTGRDFPPIFPGIGMGRDFFCGSGTGEVWKSTPVLPSSVVHLEWNLIFFNYKVNKENVTWIMLSLHF